VATDSGADRCSADDRTTRLPPRNAGNAHRRARPPDPCLRAFNGKRWTLGRRPGRRCERTDGEHRDRQSRLPDADFPHRNLLCNLANHTRLQPARLIQINERHCPVAVALAINDPWDNVLKDNVL
jgi:hypothetical protein